MTRLTVVSTCLILISLMLAGVSFARIDPETCVGLWLFDEGKGDTTKDSSGNGNNGTLISKPKWVKGQFGNALEFDGSSNFVQVPPADSLTMTKEITVAFWFRTGKKMGVFEDRQAVVGKHYLEYEVGIYPSGGVHTYTSDGAGNYDEGINCSIAGKLPEGDWILDKWYHLAWTLIGLKQLNK
ncbi:LamG domain-containing protein [Candidatus Poribacteria bacterium]|nr:LamG domain-containing protein [Candidatus Poribacteria bacterium]